MFRRRWPRAPGPLNPRGPCHRDHRRARLAPRADGSGPSTPDDCDRETSDRESDERVKACRLDVRAHDADLRLAPLVVYLCR